MLAENFIPASHAGEDQISPGLKARSAHLATALVGVEAERVASQAAAAPAQYWFINHPEADGTSLAELITADNYKNDWLRAGDVVYIAEIRRHTLTDDDLNAVAHAVIGGAQ